ncbi:MAG: acetyl-CoA C-acyltransferase [Ottowia sp.]|nr:acetyl-CoA C-acyltransferase [Ottowia sp.]
MNTSINLDPVVIVSCARTPIGAFQGELASLSAAQLGATAIAATLSRSTLDAAQINEVLMGCVLPAGQGQAPARQAALGAGLPFTASCTTINKMCGSGMRAIMVAHDMLLAGSAEIIIAGGMESMSNAPYLLSKARGGYRLGHGMLYDHMMRDGLEDSFETKKPTAEPGRSMGTFGEDCAAKYQFTRAQQDEYATRSVTRAQQATASGALQWEMAPIQVPNKKGDILIDSDEGPRRSKLDAIPQLKPAFRADGTITAASSSSISDGAAALLLMRMSTAKRLGQKPLARIVQHSTQSQAPAWFTTAPIGAIQKILTYTGWKISDVDLWEVNEAFAVVPMAAMHDLAIPLDKLNVHGGACALGHPIGASGARIVTTLLGALRRQGKQRGIASLCIGGGEATALAIELISE